MKRICLSALLLFFVGCQSSDMTSSPWTTFRSDNQLLSFDHPSALKATKRSDQPQAMLFVDQWQNVAVSVIVSNESADTDYASYMLDVAVDGAVSKGKRQPIRVGGAQGLRQDYQTRSDTKATTIVLFSERGRLLFDVAYPNSPKYAGVGERILKSVTFDQAAIGKVVVPNPAQHAGL